MIENPDLLVIGGGINGAGIARDAAGRGLSVVLVEQDDLASHTSSASTKLIHGGLRYLEHYEFRLVREALEERERLLAIAPHIIWPLRFVLPRGEGMRPGWLLRSGLFLYDHLGGRKRLPGSTSLRFDGTGLGSGLKPGISRGFAYSDCWVEDSRLVALNALDAAERGASILTRTRLQSAHRDGPVWRATLQDTQTGKISAVSAPMLVNAAGPWVSNLLTGALGFEAAPKLRLVKGSHIVVPAVYAGAHAYLLQNPDGRVIFAIPYEQNFTLIGTTDLPWNDRRAEMRITDEEIDYLIVSANRWFTRQLTPPDIVWTYAGVRPLQDDGAENASAVTRDYRLDLDAPQGQARLLSVFGGKITTYRRLAEHALDKLGVLEKPWTAKIALPGGDFPDGDFEAFLAELMQAYAFLPRPLAWRLARAYGTRALKILSGARVLADLGTDFGGGLTEAETQYLITHEFARTPDDILWRRSKLGLHVTQETKTRLAAWMKSV